MLASIRIQYHNINYIINSGFYSECKIKYINRRCILSCIELIKVNLIICYGNQELEKLISICFDKINYFSELHDYTEDFKKKCLKSYRDQAQKRVACFYFKHVEGLCFDVVEKIINLV